MRYTLRKKIKWSDNIAYAVGLLATDGNLSPDNRHINLTSKDLNQIDNLMRCLGMKAKVGEKSSSFSDRKYYYVNFSDVALYDFLIKIGLSQKKSLTLGKLEIPDKYFFHFLRGSLDGDGCVYSYLDKRWKSSFMVYLQFSCGSRAHLEWMNDKISYLLGFRGRIKLNTRVFNLVFAKKSSLVLLKRMYKQKNCISLLRKRAKVVDIFDKIK